MTVQKTLTLEEVIKALEEAGDSREIYRHLDTGEIIRIDEKTPADTVTELRQKISEDERYILLPGRKEVNDYEVMTKFAESQPNLNIRTILENALSGKGAFKRFRDELYYNGLNEHWHQYRTKAYREAAVRWCRRQGLQYTEKGKKPLVLERLNESFTIVKTAEMPVYHGEEYWFASKTDKEYSVVVRTEDVPETKISAVGEYTAWRVQGNLDFSLIGILSGITAVLAEKKIPVYVISTYDTDYIFVRKEETDKAEDALSIAGYRIETR